MCGFSGFWSFSNTNFDSYSLLNAMGSAINARGPDSSGIWFDDTNGVGLSHRRLAIVDLSEAGHQPMLSHSTRYVIAFNGDIYNHLEL